MSYCRVRVCRGNVFNEPFSTRHKVVSPTRRPPLPPGNFLVLISIRGWVDPKAIVWLVGLSKLKISTSSGTRTGDLPACSLNQLHYSYFLNYSPPPHPPHTTQRWMILWLVWSKVCAFDNWSSTMWVESWVLNLLAIQGKRIVLSF
jgi:hypothetical protein